MSENKGSPIQNRKKEEVSDLDKVLGAATIGAGGYIGRKAITNGLPGALGLQTEEHTTSKANARKILADGHLRANRGGVDGGASDKIGIKAYRKNSAGYVHLTGTKDKKNVVDESKSALVKRIQKMMYGSVHSSSKKGSADEVLEEGFKNYFGGKNNSQTLYASNPPSFYAKNFEVDVDSGFNGMKSKKDTKVSHNRLSSTIAGLKEHGLKGIRENKGRAAAYLAGTGAVGYGAAKLMQNGYNQIIGNNKD